MSEGKQAAAHLPENGVICGDCEEVLQKLPAAVFHLVFVDPPYHVRPRYPAWFP